MRSLSRTSFLLSSAFLLVLILPTHGYRNHRTVGPRDDLRFANVSRLCNGSDPANFKHGRCLDLISCVYGNLPEGFKASLASGTSIAALLPTILALIGSPPLDLVQLALMSPHRALATCCFSIGLPSGLFRQLRPLQSSLSNPNPLEPRVREWTIGLPSLSSKRWQNLLAKVEVDIIVIALASIMMWRNWVVTSFTMVPWRCEYTWLLFAWPIACMMWLAIAIGLLHLMKESIEIFQTEDPSIEYNIWSLILLPYMCALGRFHSQQTGLPAIPCDTTEAKSAGIQAAVQSAPGRSQPKSPARRTQTSLAYGSDCVTIRIIMPSNFGPRSWRWYEAMIEVMAVGIYLYATFVLTSSLFLNADQAMQYAIVMTICLSAVRILTTLF